MAPQLSIRVEETGRTMVPCPCGCATLRERLDGVLHLPNGGGWFRALLLQEPGEDGAIWLAIVTGGSAEDPRDWLVTLHGNVEGARIEDPGASPIAAPQGYSGRLVTREELLAIDGAPAFYFACFDALIEQHSRMRAFLAE
ncbi:hypothetical protein HNP48_000934 [Acidovorax soli]|uniref:Uncharacterized protein n=1 Tax=Acidovorax soli TaxID=592050 RepID=A0A7X0U897_9BURK|nr:hypothetical protein [Acidovorax soli]MBB6558270.1 hypothetical protein [Acidovorax soli]